MSTINAFPQFIHVYTKCLSNLGANSTQQAESSHLMVKGVTNKHTPMRDSVNRIYTEIKSAQREYKIALHRKMGHLPVLMDHSAFTSLKGKITHSAIAMISRELNSAKINAEKFNQQIFFGVEPGNTAIIESSGDCCISECELPMRFGLPCKCWLYQCVIDQVPIPISLIHPRWFYKGPPFMVF